MTSKVDESFRVNAQFNLQQHLMSFAENMAIFLNEIMRITAMR